MVVSKTKQKGLSVFLFILVVVFSQLSIAQNTHVNESSENNSKSLAQASSETSISLINNVPRVPSNHPRVLVRPNTIEKIKKRFSSSKMKKVRDLIYKHEQAQSNGTVSGKVSASKYKAFEAAAFLYLLEGKRSFGNKAKTMVLQNLKSISTGSNASHHRDLHRSIYAAALVYDWCYDLFTRQERLSLISEVKRLARSTQYSFPLEDVTYIVNHFGEEKVPFLLAFGIACYDEDPSIYNDATKHLYNGLVKSRNFFYPSGRHHQGSAYGSGRYEWEMLSTFLMTRMGAERPYIEEQGDILYNTMYLRRPDGVLLTEGDDYNYDLGRRPYFSIYGAMMAANEFRDGYIQDEVDRYLGSLKDPVLIMLYNDETLKNDPVDELPLTQYYGSPEGSMVARTAWDIDKGKNAGAAIATMHLGEYFFTNHDHFDGGHFSFYYKGPLAIDSGAYSFSVEGTKFGGKSSHRNNYYKRTLAHNSILVKDPDEPFRKGTTFDGINEGGQLKRIDSNPKSVDVIIAGGRNADILAHEFGPDAKTPDYSYLKGDLAKGYKHPRRPAKVEEAKRSFVFLNLFNETHPGALIVYDKVISRNASFKKRWLLHSIEEPRVSGNTTTIRRADNGYNGKLVNNTLLPKGNAADIKKVGGRGKEFWAQSASKNFALEKYSEVEAHEAGNWRIELSPSSNNKTDRFLNVMQVMDGDTRPLEVEAIDSDELVGAKIADRVVLFSKSGNRESNERSFRINATGGRINYLVTDLVAGKYDVYGPANFFSLTATEEGGAIYFKGPAGSYTIVKEGDGPLSVEDEELTTFKLYPNPTASGSSVTIEGKVKEVEVYTLLGSKIKATFKNKTLSTKQLSSGVYLLNITFDSGQQATAKLIVE